MKVSPDALLAEYVTFKPIAACCCCLLPVSHSLAPSVACVCSDYIAMRRALISADAAIPHVEAGSPSVEMRGDTASWQVIDGEGNAVSMICSLSSGMLRHRTRETQFMNWWMDIDWYTHGVARVHHRLG